MDAVLLFFFTAAILAGVYIPLCKVGKNTELNIISDGTI